MPQEWPIWLYALVLCFGVLSFVAVWTITLRGIVQELHAMPHTPDVPSFDIQSASPAPDREPRGE